MNWKCCAVVFALFAAFPSAAYSHGPYIPQNTEEERFAAAKQEREQQAKRLEEGKRMQERGVIFSYVRSAKQQMDNAWQAWQPPAKGKLLITRLKLTVDAAGKIVTSKVVAPSGSEQEDKSVKECLNKLALRTLPAGLTTLDLFWTVMADGSLNMVEFTDSPEANAYYSNLLGGTIPPKGQWLKLTSGGFLASGSGSIPVSGADSNQVARADVDFGPYMSDLQRRIKKAWVPPKGNESKRVVVVFKIHRDGNLSNLRIDHSSGVAVADAAALKGVETAAPFPPLPAGASEDVDIQFTYDYNVFNGGGHGTFRSF